MVKLTTTSSDLSSDNKHEQKLQAVLLADSFMTTFRPISLDKSTPKVLCPLNNVAMLDYSIEFLAGSGVEELFVFCVTGGDAVEKYVEQSDWTTSIKVRCVKDSSVTNAGDALRALDKLGLVVSDPFILMHGDVVTNMDISPVLREHKDRRKKDNSAIMTVLFKEVGTWQPKVTASNYGTLTDTPVFSVSPLRSLSDDLVVALADPSSNEVSTRRILLYDSDPLSPTVSLPTSFFEAHANVQIHNDLSDTGIYICSPDVLARFSDEFDYLFISKFISNSVAEEETGLQNKIFAYILKRHEYAARIHDPRTYDAVSKDLLRRWAFPVVPDNLPSGYEKVYRYALEGRMVYRERKRGGTKVTRSSVIEGPSMIGSGCSIGEFCLIKCTVLGTDCNIMDHVSITDSHLWSNVTVEDNVTISQSILCSDCIIKKGAVIPKGCIIGRGCVIGTNVHLPEFSRITMYQNDEFDEFGDDDLGQADEDEDDEDEEIITINEDELDQLEAEESSVDSDKSHSVEGVEFTGCVTGETNHSDQTIVGPDGYGLLWVPGENDIDFNDDLDQIVSDLEQPSADGTNALTHPYLKVISAGVFERIKQQSIGYDPSTMLNKRKLLQEEGDEGYISDDNAMDDEEFEENMDVGDRSNLSSVLSSSNLTGDGVLITGRQRGIDVVKELTSICLEHDDSSPIENLAIELNSFKFSQNATFGDCVTGATLALLEKLNIGSSTSAVKLASSFKSKLVKWKWLFKKFCHTHEEEQSIILALEAAAVTPSVIGEVLSTEPSFRFILQTLHDEEVISDDAILRWAGKRRDDNPNTPKGILFLQQHTQDFLKWLEEDEDEEDDESDDDNDDDDDESEDDN